MPDESKLPKWAQEKLRLLRMRLREANEKIDRLNNLTPPEEARVIADPYASRPFYLPAGTTISFVVDPGHRSGYVHARIRDNGLYLNSGERMIVHPEVSNAITVYTEKR